MSTARAPLLLTLLCALAGCAALTPQTYQLEQIHQTYTSEWVDAEFPPPSQQPGAVNGSGKFTHTLESIRNYKIQYGTDTRAAAHLTVLEGMIYLQSGSPGMAALLEPDVDAAREVLLTTSGVAARDVIIAVSYPYLVEGWSEIGKGGYDVMIERFTDAADGIADELANIPPDARAAVDVDSGGAYVATSAAIFYTWAGAVNPTPENKKAMAIKGEAVLGPWLSERERTAAVDGTFRDLEWGSRLRYLEWYAWLHDKAGV